MDHLNHCTATSKRSGTRCRNYPMHGKRVCAIHGGKTPRGIAHPSTRSGKYSQDLPTRLLATYEASRHDPELLALASDIALVDSRLVDLLRRVDTGESSQTWREAKRALAGIEEAQRRNDQSHMVAAMARLKHLITHGLADEAAWADVRQLLEQRRRLVESERKRLIEAQHLVPVEDVRVLVRALTTAVRTHVRDPDTLRALTTELAHLVPG